MNTLVTAIGLEVHVELKTATKIFCQCSTSSGVGPNLASCPVCQGQPGVLPALNPDVVHLATRCALALHCTVESLSTFERKHYVYPDLPKNYQITQNDFPLGRHGELVFDGTKGNAIRVRIKRVHMEEDAAKLEHRTIERRRVSLVNFDRCGVPLLEIVSEPDIVEPADAGLYLEKLHHLVRWHSISDADMSRGQMRCDANLSVRPIGTKIEDGVRWEIKNMNSVEGVVAALKRARELQREILVRTGSPPAEALKQTTFHWDQHKNEILRRREKETAEDYFYFVEPDLMDVRLSPADTEGALKAIETGPDKALHDLEESGVSTDSILVIARERVIYDYWREGRELYPEGAVLLANLLVNNLRACAKEDGVVFENYVKGFPAGRLAELARGLTEGKIIRNSQLNNLIKSVRSDPSTELSEAAQRMNLVAVHLSAGEQERKLRLLLDDYPQQVTDFRKGKTGVVGFLVGKARERLPGANPADLQRTLSDLLSN